MKWTGMLVVSLRGVNFGFWSCLRGKLCSSYCVKLTVQLANSMLLRETNKLFPDERHMW